MLLTRLAPEQKRSANLSQSRKQRPKSNFMLAHPSSSRQDIVSAEFMTIDTDVVREKMELRAEMKARRALFNESERARASFALCHRLALWLEGRPERTIGVYLARPQEIALDFLIEELLRQNYHVAAPRVDLANEKMSFWRLNALEELEIGPWNVRQPASRELVSDVPLILAPGLAFDRAGGRLGTGGGWYDGILQSTQTTVGVCFDCQILPRVPLESHDRAVDFVTSEARWVECAR